MRFLIYIIIIFAIGLITACNNQSKKIAIGFSQCNTDDAWRRQMLQEMQLELSFYDNIELVVMDARSSSALQIEQIEELKKQKVDLLIVSPYESNPLTKVVEEVYESGIPVVVLDRRINSEKYNSFIGGSNYSIGFGAGQYVVKSLPQNSKILEVCGLSSSSPAIERHKGFIDGINQASVDVLVDTINANWVNDDLLQKRLATKRLDDYDLVFAHNDNLALGVSEKYPLSKRPYIIGVDGLNGEGNGVEGVVNLKIDGSFVYPTGGGAAIKTALQILEGKPYVREQLLGTYFINRDNAMGIVMQYQRESGYLEKITLSRQRLDSLSKLYSNRLAMIYLLSLLLLLVIISLYIIYKGFVKYKIQSRVLNDLNHQYELQAKELSAANKQIEISTNNKLLFFNNVIHDIRTLLTLMRIPLDQLLTAKLDASSQKEIGVINSGNQRLQVLINQLLDFHKLEQKKLRLSISQSNICKVIDKVCDSFRYQAQNRQMVFEVGIPKKEIVFFFDTDKIAKVIFNLLSNSFKFTNDKGIISLKVEDDNTYVRITISDNGIGIDSIDKDSVFDRYYQSSINRQLGSGFGLNIAKEFIDLHGGEIKFESEINKGTTFYITLQKDEHKYKSDIVDVIAEPKEEFVEVQVIEEADVKQETQKGSSDDKCHTLLIVDDDYDLRSYLGDYFRANYKVYLASSGEQAIDILSKKEIDLVISDVMMPKMSGIELCSYIKSSPDLSSIACILLTALGNEEDQIKGLNAGAEDYIAKPFSITSLSSKIFNILKRSDAIRDSFSKTFLLPDQFVNSNLAIKEETPFLTKFMHYLHENYSDSELGIEKISADFNLSRIQLYRKVKSLSGYSPVEVLNDYRLKVAGNMLKNGTLNVSEICYMSGFSSPAYFSKCFKSHYGVTPNDYRKQ